MRVIRGDATVPGYESPLRYERIHAAEALRAPALEKARAVQPPGATL